jgi:hypothetical protein
MKELKFIHITKCGGSSIEDIGKDNNIYWGKYDNLYKDYNLNYHDYPSKFPLHIQEKYDWFMIVRDPYDRILSEYYCNWGGIGEFNNLVKHSKNQFNTYLINKIKNRNNNNNNTRDGFHYLPQFSYLLNNKNNNVHILKIENLEKDFKELTETYNLNLNLNKHINKSKFIKNFTINDFSFELIQIINKVYKEDFRIFNYKMISKKINHKLGHNIFKIKYM